MKLLGSLRDVLTVVVKARGTTELIVASYLSRLNINCTLNTFPDMYQCKHLKQALITFQRHATTPPRHHIPTRHLRVFYPPFPPHIIPMPPPPFPPSPKPLGLPSSYLSSSLNHQHNSTRTTRGLSAEDLEGGDVMLRLYESIRREERRSGREGERFNCEDYEECLLCRALMFN